MSEPALPERVVFVCSTYLPRVTGVATAMHAWARQLADLDIRVTVVAPEYPPFAFYPPPAYPDGLEVVRLPSRPAPLVMGIQTAQPRGVAWETLLSELRGSRALIHGQDVLLAGEVALKIGRRCRLPVMLHSHYPLGDGALTDWLPFQVGRAGRKALDAALHLASARKARSVCRRAHTVATVTTYVGDLLRQHRIADPVIIPCGVDALPASAGIDIRKRHAIPTGSPIFLYTGRMDPDKRIGDLLQAAAFLREREPRIRVLLVGGGPYLQRYIDQAEALHLADTVIFSGWVPYRDIWAYYEQADLFLLASPHEAQGLVAIEAQAVGLPVVAYRGGGISIIVEDGRTGVLTDNTPKELANAALDLWNHPSRRQAMSASARQQAALYAIDRVFPTLLETYQRITQETL